MARRRQSGSTSVCKDTRHTEAAPAPMLTVDIGGGSVELIHWTQDRILGDGVWI